MEVSYSLRGLASWAARYSFLPTNAHSGCWPFSLLFLSLYLFAILLLSLGEKWEGPFHYTQALSQWSLCWRITGNSYFCFEGVAFKSPFTLWLCLYCAETANSSSTRWNSPAWPHLITYWPEENWGWDNLNLLPCFTTCIVLTCTCTYCLCQYSK